MILDVDISPKALREALCMAQAALVKGLHIVIDQPIDVTHVRKLQKLIDAIDVLRPLGPDGKHGDRHTPYCGCEDLPSHWHRYVGVYDPIPCTDKTCMDFGTRLVIR
jgi:hypothetical protein